jgi:hypothetical protein
MSVSWLPVLGLFSQPAAQRVPSAAVATPNRSFSPVPRLSLGSNARLAGEPLTAKVVNGTRSVSRAPTIVSPLLSAVMPNGSRLAWGDCGLFTVAKLLPFQDSISPWLGKALPDWPAA